MALTQMVGIIMLILVSDIIYAEIKDGSKNINGYNWGYVEEDYDDSNYLMLGLFNVESSETTANFLPKYININDGLVLAEAMRYAIREINKMKFLNRTIGYKIVDSKESRSAFSRYKDIPAVLGLTPWQISYFLTTNQRGASPLVSSLTSSFAFDHEVRQPIDSSYMRLFRTVPSSYLEIMAIIDILKHLGFSYVAIIASNDDRTQEMVTAFVSLAQERGICIATSIWLSIKPAKSEYMHALKKIIAIKNARVVVLFTMIVETKGILKAAEMVPEIVFISGTAWRASNHTVNNAYKAAKGSIVLQFDDIFDQGFEDYFMSLDFNSNKYRWFGEFWSRSFGCSLPREYTLTRVNDNKRRCLGNETLTNKHVDLNYAVVKPILNAVESLVCALKHAENFLGCNISSVSCIREIMKNSLKYFGKETCALKNSVSTNRRAFYYRNFTILNFNGEAYRQIGIWNYNSTAKKNKLLWNADEIIWRSENPPLSFCYIPCGIGEVPDRGPAKSKCCYTCKKCGKFDIVKNGTCVQCRVHEFPDRTRSICLRLPIVTIEEQANIHKNIIKSGAGIGISLTTITTIIFIKYRKARIIKATGRDLTFITLFALQLVFGSALVFLMAPDEAVCGLQRFIVGFSLNACYAPILLKTNRIYRIFNASKLMVMKTSFVSPRSQILTFLCLMLVQLFLGVMWVINKKAEVLSIDIHEHTNTAILCKFDSVNSIFNLIPCLITMAACTFFAFKTRNFPENFNEAFSISITLYISCILWAIFIPMLFSFNAKSANVFVSTLLLAYFMVIIGMVTLVGLFKPIVRRLLFQSKRQRTTRVTFESDTSVKTTELSSLRQSIARRDTIASRQKEARDIGTDAQLPDVCYCESLKALAQTQLKHQRRMAVHSITA